jgi:hypothetical protein
MHCIGFLPESNEHTGSLRAKLGTGWSCYSASEIWVDIRCKCEGRQAKLRKSSVGGGANRGPQRAPSAIVLVG